MVNLSAFCGRKLLRTLPRIQLSRERAASDYRENEVGARCNLATHGTCCRLLSTSRCASGSGQHDDVGGDRQARSRSRVRKRGRTDHANQCGWLGASKDMVFVGAPLASLAG